MNDYRPYRRTVPTDQIDAAIVALLRQHMLAPQVDHDGRLVASVALSVANNTGATRYNVRSRIFELADAGVLVITGKVGRARVTLAKR